MQIQNLRIDRYKTKMKIDFPVGTYDEKVSAEYTIDGLVKYQIQLKITPIDSFLEKRRRTNPYYTNVSTFTSNESCMELFVKFTNVVNNSSIYIRFFSKALQIQDMFLKADSNWHMIIQKFVTISTFDIYFTLDVENDKFKILYDDDELTDFELRGDDGSVKVHKCMLAATSPVFKTMIQGDWKETREGSVRLEGMSKSTLQEFKQYIYLNSLPSPVSQQILIIAMCYQIPDMEIACVKNLIDSLNVDSICELLDFAATHKSYMLKIAILEHVQKGFIKVDEIKKRLPNEEKKETEQTNVTKETT